MLKQATKDFLRFFLDTFFPKKVSHFLKNLFNFFKGEFVNVSSITQRFQSHLSQNEILVEAVKSDSKFLHEEINRLKSLLILNDSKLNLALWGMPNADPISKKLTESPLMLSQKIIGEVESALIKLRGDPSSVAVRYANRFVELKKLPILAGFDPRDILDVGCGNGLVTSVVVDRFEGISKIRGVDYSPINFFKINLHNQSRKIDLEYRQTSAMNEFLINEGEHFSLITLIHCYEHLGPNEQVLILPLLLDRMRSGDVAYIEVPNLFNWFVARDFFWADPQHLRPFSGTQISEILKTLPCEFMAGVYDQNNSLITIDEFLKKEFNEQFPYLDLFFLIRKK